MQEVLPQQAEALKANLDSYVQEAAQEGNFFLSFYKLFNDKCRTRLYAGVFSLKVNP
jgi:hypothetical protein